MSKKRPYDPRTVATVVAMLEERIVYPPRTRADLARNRETYAILADLGALPVALPRTGKQVIQ